MTPNRPNGRIETMKTKLLSAVAAAAVFAGAANPAFAATKTAIFAGGCFWTMEKAFEATPGVVDAVSGYGGGTRSNPTYEDHEGYLEAVKVTYDPARISYAQLVDAFYHHIDPTDPSGQVCDKGPTYRTAVFVSTPEERQVAEAEKARVQKFMPAPVTVSTRQATTFYPAEAYHQDFAKKNPAAYERYRVGCGRDRVLSVVWAGH
jgi:peptide-methionine (S)-S-oxide reductase